MIDCRDATQKSIHLVAVIHIFMYHTHSICLVHNQNSMYLVFSLTNRHEFEACQARLLVANFQLKDLLDSLIH